MSVEAFAYPSTVKEAVNLLGDSARRAVPVGGGTALAQGSRRGASLLVDITRCGLDAIEVRDAQIELGAALSCAELCRQELPGATGVLLRETAAGIATQPLRNAITLGGNLVHLASWADFPVALLALDARVQIEHLERGPYTLSMAELVAEHPTRVLPHGALVTGVSVPRLPAPAGATYRRFRTSTVDYALVSVAAVVELDGKRCRRAAVAVGAVGPRPVRAPAAEQLLSGATPGAKKLAEAAAAAAAEITVVPNFRMPAELRQRILEVEIRRALEEATRRARQGGAA